MALYGSPVGFITTLVTELSSIKKYDKLHKKGSE